MVVAVVETEEEEGLQVVVVVAEMVIGTMQAKQGRLILGEEGGEGVVERMVELVALEL
jgi:hypothetical protein